MISSIDDGYYLIKTSGGEADTNGEFMFEIDCGYKINREYGSEIFKLLDAPMNGATKLRIMAATVMAIINWEPRVR